MARNQEKAQSMLFRFREAQLIDMGMMRDPREKLRVEDVQSIRECEEQRSLLVTDISRKISRINEGSILAFYAPNTLLKFGARLATMPDHLVRDLNDEINRLLRRKARWEYRIKEMGGPDYRRSAGKILDAQGKEVPGQRGYRYVGSLCAGRSDGTQRGLYAGILGKPKTCPESRNYFNKKHLNLLVNPVWICYDGLMRIIMGTVMMTMMGS